MSFNVGGDPIKCLSIPKVLNKTLLFREEFPFCIKIIYYIHGNKETEINEI